ncbi:hypothetical protein ACHAQH_006545 [Verticillium albo-atrum]
MPDEQRRAENIIEAVEEAGLQHLVYSSVVRASEHESFPGWKDDPSNYPLSWYWLNKASIEAKVRNASIPTFTILRPAFFTANFAHPDCRWMFPGLADAHELRHFYQPETRLHLVDLADIARFTAESVSSPAKWAGKVVSLASEALTVDEIAQSDAVGKVIRPVRISDDEAAQLKAQGHVFVDAQIWHRELGYGVNVERVTGYDIPLTTFAEMLRRDGTGW